MQTTEKNILGDRVLAWQVDMAENANYDSAYAYAQTACMESIHLTIAWSSMEPDLGNFDMSYLNNVLDVANVYYPAYGTMAELQIPTMNTNVKVTPLDLLNTDFDSPVMINRFKTLLDTVFAHMPAVELAALNIGNESDIYMGIDPIQYGKYKVFLDSIVPYAKQLYFNLHGVDLKVGTTFTFDGLVSATTSTLCQAVNSNLDIVSVTYYPLNPDFTMEFPSVVSGDFNTLVNMYPDTLQPIYFAECGYASSITCNSSETAQAQFFQNIFSVWDTLSANIKYITLFKTTDWSQQEVDDLAVFYGINDPIFLEYLRTLGVRTWANDGSNKQAYEVILCELSLRGWCNASCAITGVEVDPSDLSLEVYPNPGRGLVVLEAEQAIQKVELYDNRGAIVAVFTQPRLQIGHLTKGIYSLRAEMESGEILWKRFVKN